MKPLDLTTEQIAPAFPGAAPGTIARYWPAVRAALQDAQLDSPRLVAYALATIAAETASFAPRTEMLSRFNTRNPRTPFDRYEGRLGNVRPGDGARYAGRGFVQLTGRANYRTYGERIDQPLEEHPERANEPAIAAQLLALFIADRVHPIESALKARNFAAARCAVNGGTHGLDRFTRAYTAILEALGAPQSREAPV